MNSYRQSWPALILLAALAWSTTATAQEADDVNHISEILVEEADDVTRIRIAGDQHPTYSVYRLRNPVRVFVDVANSELSNVSENTPVGNGVIAQVAAVEYEDALTQVSRIIIAFDQDAHYDVTSDGTDLIVEVDGSGRVPFLAGSPESDEEMMQLMQELEASEARIAALSSAVQDAETRAASAEAEALTTQLDYERAEQERLAAIAAASDLETEVASITSAHNEALQSLEAVQGTLEEQRAHIARLETERSDALARIERLQADQSSMTAELSARDSELESLRGAEAELSARIESLQSNGNESAELADLLAERDARLAELQSREAELSSLVAEAAANEDQLRQALDEAHRAREEQQSLVAQLDAANNAANAEAEALRAEAEAARQQTAEAEQLVFEAEQALAEAETQAASVEQLQERWTTETPEIADIQFEHVDGVDRIVIQVAAGASYTSLPWDDGRASIIFDNAVLPDPLRRTLDTQAFNGPVAFVSSFTDTDGSVQVVAELQGAASELIRADGDTLVWEFMSADSYASADTETGYSELPSSSPPAQPYSGTYTSQAGGGGVSALPGYTTDSPFRQPVRMSNKRVSIDIRNADIDNVLRFLADEGNLNIVASDAVEGTVTLRLRSVPLDQAMSVILEAQGLGWRQEGNILRVAPLEEFEAEYELQLERFLQGLALEPLQVRLVPVSYASASQLTSLVSGVLSGRGSVSVDSRNNTLIITDVYDHLQTAEALVAQLDNQTPQILIEARIVETNDNFRRDLGIQWGGDFVADQSTGNSTGLLFPSTIGIAGGATDGQTPLAGSVANPNFAVNLPASTGTGEGGAIGLSFGNLSGSLNLNVRLSAAESEGSIKIVTTPRIMTLNNEEAYIRSGVSIPVSVVSAAGAQTVFFDAALELRVTPRVTPDGMIMMDVNVSKNEPDFENSGARGDPSVITREARTQLLVRDGDTTVIGGLFQSNVGFSRSGVPFFSRLPVIGPLFRNSSSQDVRNELLIFITPRVVNREQSIGMMGGDDINAPLGE